LLGEVGTVEQAAVEVEERREVVRHETHVLIGYIL
jgi:hypothetical protein